MGLFLAHLAASKGSRVLHYLPEEEHRHQLRKTRSLPSVLPGLDPLHPQIRWIDDLEEMAAEVRLVLLVGAPDPIENTIDRLGDVLDGSHLVLHALHRLYPPGLQTTSRLVRQRTCCLQIGALAGSLRLEEMIGGSPAAAMVGSAFPHLIELAVKLLGGPQLCLLGHPDLLGVEYAATLVEILEVAMGLVGSLELGTAIRAMFVVRGLAELSRLGRFLGGTTEPFEGLPGLARLLVTVHHYQGPNYLAGSLLAGNVTGPTLFEEAPPEARGLALIGPVRRFAEQNDLSLPLVTGLDEVCQGHLAPHDLVEVVIRGS
ncbi:MAG: hypothetical protein JW797_13160 [Bradymonadales bacterium]|nr:hypothetical protein [Bradymonadales bacterium]